ncbi:MAG: hypothetical protein J3Q66DRAFT_440039 [Benniella sp.]|nr:MAG: hypothetical protein J3Q66DRAFT_440039 [Benniella sp.]
MREWEESSILETGASSVVQRTVFERGHNDSVTTLEATPETRATAYNNGALPISTPMEVSMRKNTNGSQEKTRLTDQSRSTRKQQFCPSQGALLMTWLTQAMLYNMIKEWNDPQSPDPKGRRWSDTLDAGMGEQGQERFRDRYEIVSSGNCYRLPQSLTLTCGRDGSSLRSRPSYIATGISELRRQRQTKTPSKQSSKRGPGSYLKHQILQQQLHQMQSELEDLETLRRRKIQRQNQSQYLHEQYLHQHQAKTPSCQQEQQKQRLPSRSIIQVDQEGSPIRLLYQCQQQQQQQQDPTMRAVSTS